MSDEERRPERGPEWQPTYPVWAPAVLASTFLGAAAASAVTGWISPGAIGSPLELAPSLGSGEAAQLPPVALAIVVVMATVAGSVPPGLLSLFLITLTDARLRLHPLIGATIFGLVGGVMAQTAAAALFAATFGLVSLGGIAAALAVHRHMSGST